MLKALELVGFKSFAERTRFDFPDGITVIVGPNGSGKSNVVDAMKWVLGAQSPKALRGKDMADVIFKGSAAGGRKPGNSAEATLFFDNSGGVLPVDTPEVQVTRRVYRSGESEYLINREPCRLKDIKDLFRGTGVGVDAYSLIEQGKVDRMLQASSKDRRVIFEEAAGISRYKAKRQEAERRLQRVEQNLLRLGDLVREMEERLERLKSQAGKAQRFRAMSERLLMVRTQLGLADYVQATSLLEQTTSQIDEATSEGDQAKQQLLDVQARVQECELELHEVARQAGSVEQQLRETQHTLTAMTSDQRGAWQRREDCEAEIVRQQTRLKALRQRAGTAQGQVDQLRSETEAAQEKLRQTKIAAEAVAKKASQAEELWQKRQQETAQQRQRYLDHLRLASEQSTLASGYQSQLVELQRSVVARERQLAQAHQSEQEASEQVEKAQIRLDELAVGADSAQQILEHTQNQLEEMRRVVSRRQEDAAALQGRLEGARERLLVLEELEHQQEGIGLGAKQLLQLAQDETIPPWNSIRGLVADLLEVDIHLAPLVDIALGSLAQSIVLNDGQIIQQLRDGALELDGRVTLLRLERLPSRRNGERIQLDGLRGVIGRADRMVRYAPQHEALMRYLLGTTWLVDSLATALDLSHFRGAGLRFVTASGQLVDSDGTITLGASQTAVGLVARRSEMQAARNEIQHYAYQLREAHQEIERLQDNIDQHSRQIRKLDQAHRERQSARHDQQLILDSAQYRLSQFSQSRVNLAAELQDARLQREDAQVALNTAQSELAVIQTAIAVIESTLAVSQTESEQVEESRRELQQLATERRIDMAKAEQRLDSLQAALDQVTRDQSERKQAVQEALEQLELGEEKLRSINLLILQLTSKIANASLLKETFALQFEQLARQANTLRTKRQQLQKEKDSTERLSNRIEDRIGKLRMELERVESSRSSLCQRFMEDHQLDLRNQELLEQTAPLEDRGAAEQEVIELRAEIQQVGAVNMEALHELDAEQSRFDALHSQYSDLRNAKESLEKLIQKINVDSRRLFMETLEAIRKNFQVLYRKSFGGGNADLILEEGPDDAECGVDIIATPPGKTALSNSLLSGGEKALTAVALLLAIFQFRPSPFCVLDEVDAPFDEANIGRFVKVLEEFLSTTKFIVVTHSKKTMTASTTLYGVTMEESGVSKKVAVRFEEVGDNGEILSPPSPSAAPAMRRAA